MDAILETILKLQNVNISGFSFNNKQLMLFKNLETDEFQSYLTQIQSVKSASNGIFNTTAAQQYSQAIQGLEAQQAALLLSTQGLTNAQIAETLAINESNVAKNYQAMLDAGLLSRKQTLTLAQVQENLQTILGTEAKANEAISSLELSIISKGEEAQTVKLTSKKLQEAVATGVLTKAQEQELLESTLIQLNMDQPQLSN